MTFNHAHGDPTTKRLGHSNRTNKRQKKNGSQIKTRLYGKGKKMESQTCRQSTDKNLTRKMSLCTPPRHPDSTSHSRLNTESYRNDGNVFSRLDTH